MSDMAVKSIKLTKDVYSTKVLYEKRGRLFIRSGRDKFTTGELYLGSKESLGSAWGYRKVLDAPTFRDSKEMLEGVSKFQMKQDGTVEYYQ